MDAAGPEMIVSIKDWPQSQLDLWFSIQHQVRVAADAGLPSAHGLRHRSKC
jgi:hypothetical protein